ncbi:MAG: signal peptidase II [Clostridia bacterium]
MPEEKKLKSKIDIILIIVFILIILCDQLSKIFIISNDDKEDISKGNITISFNKYKSENEYYKDNYVTTIATDIVVFIIVIKFLKTQKERMSNKVKISLILILAGGIGNFIDKVWNRQIIGFIKLGNLPLLNIAYIFIFIGWILFALSMAYDTIKTRKEIKQKAQKNDKTEDI